LSARGLGASEEARELGSNEGRTTETDGRVGRTRTVIGRVRLDGGCEVLRGGVVVARCELLVAGVLGLERGLALLGGDLRRVRGGADGTGRGQTARAGGGGADREAAHVG